jgi:hypothetical protein
MAPHIQVISAARIVFLIIQINLIINTLCLSQGNPFPEYAPIYKDDVIARVDITLPQDSLEVILAPGNEQSDYHFHATFSFDNGVIQETIENVGFRLRGNTSRLSAKKSFKVSFNTYEPGRRWYGVEKLNLNGEHNDPTISRSKICWDLLREIGVPAPRASHVQLYINGSFYGIYANIEHIDEEFVNTRFGNKNGNLYKCLWPADLNYLGSDPDLYKFMLGGRRTYDLKTNEDADDYSDLANFIDILNNTPIPDLRCKLEPIFNINPFLLSMAFDILAGNWDGPLFNKNNFYLYHNQETGKFEYILYDLDNTFGIDWFGINWSERDIYTWGPDSEARPLYWRILEVQEYRDRFSLYLNRIIGELYTESALFSKINEVKILIEPFIQDDTYYPLDYGFSIEDFHNSFELPLPHHHTPIGLQAFITERRNATINQLQIVDVAPIVSNISNNHPNVFGDISILAYAEDDQGLADIQLCYQLEGMGHFSCIDMYDDGLHLDDEPGDGLYGALIPPSGSPTILSYYILATDLNNNDTRAPVCGKQQIFIESPSVKLAINELMASNDTTITDNFNEYDDWVELYNYGEMAVYLGDLYLSDDPDNPTRWQMPDIWIQSREFLLIWTDNDEEQGDLHSSFSLSAGGEFIGIFDNDVNSNSLIDGLEFNAQEPDQAYGRLPNGTGPFQILPATPGSSNEVSSSLNKAEENSIHYLIYPNPAQNVIYLKSDQTTEKVNQVVIINTIGQEVLQVKWKENMWIDIGQLPGGLYYLCALGNGYFKSLGKMIKK